MSVQKPVRCAIYTRKSSEEGLDQAFNSLQAQREACEAYVLSQAHEGWRASKTAFDDGGFSGGTIERPALQRLLEEIDAGLIDTIVVYKIDRLTRSLADFARIVERLEAAGASFVSVTQAFNTTTSMGRLTLNVLLSFAQFEREVTGERIRDKIAASKRKGMWMGGRLPLGYDVPVDLQTRALVANQTEAATVIGIYRAYLDLGSVAALMAHLDSQGVRSKAANRGDGSQTDGSRFGRGALYHLLQNRTYLGEITHRGASYPGAHPPIVPAELFEAVQQKLASQRRERRARPQRSAAMALTGRLFDAAGQPMSPAFAYGKSGRVYRYYVSAPLQQGDKTTDHPSLRRIAAPALEEAIAGELSRRLGRAEATPLTMMLKPVRRLQLDEDGILVVLAKRDVPRALVIASAPHLDDPALCELRISMACRVRGGRTWVSRPVSEERSPRPDATLIRGLRQAHRLAANLGWDMTKGVLVANDAHAPKSPYERRLCRLAFLAPDLQRAILDGHQPPGLTLDQLLKAEISPDWSRQRALLATAF